MFSVVLCILGFVAVAAQEPCSPMDAGEWTPVKPVLYAQVHEATEQDLLLYPDDSMYHSELRINGVLDENSPNGIIVEPQKDFLIVNPAEVFKFETVSGHNRIRLFQPIDRDGPSESFDDDTDVIRFTLKCSPANNRTIEVYYDVSILILDKNDNPPLFTESSYETTINELTPLGTHVLTVTAVDKDSNLEGNITYSIVKDSGIMNDGSGVFDIDTLHGKITVKGQLDYETLSDNHKYYIVRVVVMDGGPIKRRSAYTDVKIHVTDGNENGPSFIYTGCLQHKMTCLWPKYTTDINAIELNTELVLHGVPDVSGNAVEILAKDMDAVPTDIEFSIARTYPSGYDSYFTVQTIQQGTYFKAIVKQVKNIDMKQHKIFEIFLKAEELSPERRYDTAMILFVGQVHSEDSVPATTQAPPSNTDAQTAIKPTSSDATEEFTTTTVALIVVIAVTLTIVVCLALVMICLVSRKHQYSDEKALLKSLQGGRDNKGFSSQL